MALGQFEAEKSVTISTAAQDDVYLAGETVSVNASIGGDMVAAGGKIVIKDTIQQDLVVAGGEVHVRGYVKDDVRAAGGELTLDNIVEDDVIVFGGEVEITEDAIIHGNLINFSGTIDLNGEVKGMVKAHGGELNINGKIAKDATLNGGDILIDGEIRGTSTIAAEEIEIGDNAKFYGDVEYWSEEGVVDFKNSLINARATINEELAYDRKEFSWKKWGMATLGFWVFYVLSTFLILLLLNWAFKEVFVKAVEFLEGDFWKSLGYGLIYLVGLPFLIAVAFMIVIGIPISMFLLAFYIFSILFGHLVAALLLTHFLNKRREKPWGFWTLVFVALGIAIVLRLLTVIPFIGWLISLVLLAVSYGVIALAVIPKKGNLEIVKS
ncbi:hypothetical protein FGF1_25580 [Flavobacteriaceae bacterium GF1]